MSDITSSADRIEVSDITDRVEELRGEHEALKADLDEAADARDDQDGPEERPGTLEANVTAAAEALAEWVEENGAELTTLESLLDDIKGHGGNHQWEGDWYPDSLINDHHFVDAMEELVKDIGDIPEDTPGYLVIDWEATAKNLQVDYSTVEFEGVTFWYR